MCPSRFPPGTGVMPKRFLRTRSHLYRRLLWLRYGPRTSSVPDTSTREQSGRDHAIEQAWRLALWGIERLYGESTAAGSVTRVVVMPGMADVTGETRGSSRIPRLRQEPDQRGLSYIDLSEAMSSAYRSGRQLHFLQDGHLTPEGHAVAAAALLEPLASLLLDPDSSCAKLGKDRCPQ